MENIKSWKESDNFQYHGKHQSGLRHGSGSVIYKCFRECSIHNDIGQPQNEQLLDSHPYQWCSLEKPVWGPLSQNYGLQWWTPGWATALVIQWEGLWDWWPRSTTDNCMGHLYPQCHIDLVCLGTSHIWSYKFPNCQCGISTRQLELLLWSRPKQPNICKIV